ncbi:MAG: hypothetical protein M1832_001659 [Thelocarpon impressellum]|nr:MAG: hypothetical protein M1832_001659 [Thelocarpon impressellum]
MSLDGDGFGVTAMASNEELRASANIFHIPRSRAPPQLRHINTDVVPSELGSLHRKAPSAAPPSGASSPAAAADTPTSDESMHAPSAASQRRRYLATSSNPALAVPDVLTAMTSTERNRAAQSARREMLVKIRDDWEFVAPSSPGSSAMSISSARRSDDSDRAVVAVDLDEPEANVQYVARSFSSTSSMSASPASSPPSAFKYDSPDSVATTLARRAASRRRRRREALDAEQAANPGLRHWTAQRHAWTGSVLRRAQAPPGATPDADDAAEEADEVEELIPLHPPLLPATHPIRRTITPECYPTLYSKVVVRGQAPNVPVGLQHLIAATVQGWKADGEWPPKAAPAEAPLGGKKDRDRDKDEDGGDGQRRKRSMARGVGAVKKVLGL